MPDWLELVRERLSGLALDAAEQDEVHAELASHLEESYETLLKEGMNEQAAVSAALFQVTDWQDLQRMIFDAKRRGHIMKKRLHQLWIPGFLTLILSTLFLMTLQRVFGVRPRIVGSGPGTILFYVPWLVALPFIGALGAYISSRAGGSRGTLVFASTFPALALAAAFLLMFPIGMIIERVTGNDLAFGVVATALLSNWIGWIVVPGAALLAGGLLVQLSFSPRSSSHETAIG
jgi:hypothetical protein